MCGCVYLVWGKGMGGLRAIRADLRKCWVNYLPALHFSEQYFTFSQSRARYTSLSYGDALSNELQRYAIWNLV
jgi:hypothetical protein